MFFVCCSLLSSPFFLFFFFNDTATTEIYTLSLHDALPISTRRSPGRVRAIRSWIRARTSCCGSVSRSEEHTSELQSPCNLVCRLLLEKKKQRQIAEPTTQPPLIDQPKIAHTSTESSSMYVA